jgi:hypothetical protein
MCYYALSIFLSCGHAVRAEQPIAGLSGCPLRRKETSDRQFMRTPSLTNSMSTQASRRTTIESTRSSLQSTSQCANPETPCDKILTHPMYTHRSEGNCPECWQETQKRLRSVETAVAEEQRPIFEKVIEKVRKDKTTIEGTRPRRLMLVDRRDAQNIEARENAKALAHPPSTPRSTSDGSSTYAYMKELWSGSKTLRSLHSPLGAETMGPANKDEAMSPVEVAESMSPVDGTPPTWVRPANT